MGNPSGNHNHISSTLQNLKREQYWGGETIKSTQNKKQVKSWCPISFSTHPHHPFSVPSDCRIGYRTLKWTCLHHQWYCKLWYSLGKQNSDFTTKKAQAPVYRAKSNSPLATGITEPTQDKGARYSSAKYTVKNLEEGGCCHKTQNQMLSMVSNWITLLPSTYTHLHAHRSSLAWEKAVNRNAKRTMKSPNLTISSVRLHMLCQRNVPAQCRGRCCRQHLLGGLPISATIQPFNACKDLAQEQFLSAFHAVSLLTPAHVSPLLCRAATKLPSFPQSGLCQCSPTLLPNLLNFFLLCRETLW